MEFNWINIWGGIIVVLILLPNMIYTIKSKGCQENQAPIPKYLTVFEQIGRYGCMILMVFPLFVWEFGFSPMEFLFFYFAANGGLLISYYVCWIAYSRKKRQSTALALAVIPTLIFMISGFLLKHWALVGFAVLFGIFHCTITIRTHKNCS